MKKTLFLLWVAMLFWDMNATAQSTDLEVKVEVDPDTILMDNVFYIVYTLQGADGDFEAPPFKDFDVVSQSSGSSISIVNGETSRTASYTFALRPHEPGNFIIDPATITTKNGSVVETSPIELTVYPNPTGRQITPRRMEQMDLFGRDFFGQKSPFEEDFFGLRRDKKRGSGQKHGTKRKKKRYKF